MKDILEKEKDTSAAAQQMVQDGDRLKLKFIQNTRDPGGRPLVIFLAGNVYPGFIKISADGIKFILKHEYIPYQGTESEFSKEKFIDNLKEHGAPCEVLDCNNSYIFRGDEKIDFAEAISELFGSPRSKSEFEPKPKVKSKPRPRPGEDERPVGARCDEFNFKIDKSKGRKHKGRKKAKFIVTGNEDFLGDSEGNFKHYEQKFLNEMGICSFDEFYDAIEDCFGPEWQDKVLAKHGMDYYFRDEHERAYKILLINEDEGTCPTDPENKDKPPILDPDYEPETEKPSCEELEQEWNEYSLLMLKLEYVEVFLKRTNEAELADDPDYEPIDNPQEILLSDGSKLGDRIVTAEEWALGRDGVERHLQELENQGSERGCPPFQLSFNPEEETKKITDDVKKSLKKPAAVPPKEPGVPTFPTLHGKSDPREYSREDLDIRSGATTPSAHINYGRNYMVYGHEDPLGKYPQDGNRYILSDKLRELFGYDSWVKYRQENLEDLRKKIEIMGKDGIIRTGKQKSLRPGDITLSAPTLWPIHVAMALEEFSNSYEAEQYLPVLLFDSAEQRNEARIRAEELNIALPDETTLGAMTENERNLLEKRFGLTGLGDAAGQGAFEMGVRNPFEGLLEGGQNALGKAFAAMKARSGLLGPVQVTDKNGRALYWLEGDPGPDLASDVDETTRQKALNTIAADAGAKVESFPGLGGYKEVGWVTEVPSDWRTRPEFKGLVEYLDIMGLPPVDPHSEEGRTNARWEREEKRGTHSVWLIANQRPWNELSRQERERVLEILKVDVGQSKSRPTITSDISTLERAAEAGYKFEKLMVDPSDGIQMAGIVPLKAGPIVIPGTDIELGNIYFFPSKGTAAPLTKAEDVLFKRLGIKNSEFQEKGFIYLMNLDTKETNVFNPPNYRVSSEEDSIWKEADRWKERQGEGEQRPPVPPEEVVPPEETVDQDPGGFDKVRSPATETGIDPKWIHGVMMTESRGNCNARAFNNQILKLIYAKVCGDDDECTKKEKRSSKLRTKIFGDDEAEIEKIKKALEGAGLIKNGPTYNDHKNDPNSQFHKAFKIAPKAAIAVTAWGTYQVLGLYRRMLMDAEPSEFYGGWFEGNDRDRCDLSAALFEEWVEASGKSFVSKANEAVRSDNISDWYESISPYHGRASCSNKPAEKGEIYDSGKISVGGVWFQDDKGIFGEPGKKYCRSNLDYAIKAKGYSREWEGEVPSAVVPKPSEEHPGDVGVPGIGADQPVEVIPPEGEAEPIPREEEETPGALVPIENPIPDEEINEELGLVRFNGFKRVRSASDAVAFAQPIAINFLKGLAKVNDGHWRIGDMSGPRGGRIALHNSHQTGLDIDVAIPMAKDKFTIFTKDEEPEKFTRPSGRLRRAAKRGWDYSKGHIVSREQIKKIIDLVGAVIDAGAILIFIDKSIGNPIKEIIRNKLDDGSLDSKYKIAGKQNGGLIQHWPNHEDHFHIRFPLSKEECSGPKCNSTYLKNWVTPDKMLAYKKKHLTEIRYQHENLNLSNIFDLINEVLGDKK